MKLTEAMTPTKHPRSTWLGIYQNVLFCQVLNMQQITRCPWVGEQPIYIDYHDKEWESLNSTAKSYLKKICLEGQQAGLSWITVLKKRESYRVAFHQFDPKKNRNNDRT